MSELIMIYGYTLTNTTASGPRSFKSQFKIRDCDNSTIIGPFLFLQANMTGGLFSRMNLK